MKITKFLGVLSAACLLFAACGDDGGGSADSNEYSEAIAEMLKEEEDNPFSDDDIDCLAAELVDAVGGPSALEDAGVTPENIGDSEGMDDLDLDLTDEEADEAANSFSDCGISLTEAIFDELGDEVPEDVRDCLEENVSDDDFADLFAESLITGEDPGDDDLPPSLATAFTECIGG